MKTQTCYYDRENGWDTQPDSGLDSDNTLVIVFGDARPKGLEEPLKQLADSFPVSCVIGCSTAGEIYNNELRDGGLAVAIAQFEHTTLRLATIDQASIDQSGASGKALAEQLQDKDLQSVFMLSEGLHINGSQLLHGVTQALPDSVVVTGGLAADHDRFDSTWVLTNGKPSPDKVVAVGFYGPHVKVSHGSRGGWDVMGPERKVTRSDGNLLYELDGQPALELYKKYLGERAEGLPATGLLFPLAIRNTDEVDGLTVRTILAVDEDQQSITFAGDVPEGVIVQMMYANFDRLVDGANDASSEMSETSTTSGDKLCVAISCVGRRLILGQRTDEEIEAVSDVMPDNTRLVGFYSYGEISPLASGRCDLHNQTMTVTLFGESTP